MILRHFRPIISPQIASAADCSELAEAPFFWNVAQRLDAWQAGFWALVNGYQE